MRQLLAISALTLFATTTRAADYDPLRVEPGEVRQLELVVADKPADGTRERPILVYLPASDTALPIVLFSHGLGGSRTTCQYLGEHWARRGYVAVFVQHPGSDESVWKGVRPFQIMAAMKRAASWENTLLRLKDIPAVIDALEKWNQQTDHPLHATMDPAHIGMSGHSFGAVTTQGVCGQATRLGTREFTDVRIDAAIAFSPSDRGGAVNTFSKVSIPWMLMTGTNDVSPIGDQTVETRLSVFPKLPESVDRYQLVLQDAEHSAFTDRPMPGERGPRNPNHHKAILAFSTAFWDVYLKQDAEALEWLQGDQVRTILEPKDQWESRSAR